MGAASPSTTSRISPENRFAAGSQGRLIESCSANVEDHVRQPGVRAELAMLYNARRVLGCVAIAAVLGGAPEAAVAGGYGDRLVTEGHEFFKTGNFFRASES